MSLLRSYCATRTRATLIVIIAGFCATASVVAPKAAVAARNQERPPAETTGPFEMSAPPALPSYSTPDLISFAVLGNTAPPAPGMPVPSLMFRIYDDIGLIHPDLIFHTGNFIWTQGDYTQAKDDMVSFAKLTSDLKIPFYIAPGGKDIPDEAAQVAFHEAISGPTAWRSFDYGKSHFIILDSDSPQDPGRISAKQMAWLQNDLQQSSTAAHIFVFVHRTPYPTDPAGPADAVFDTTTDRDALTSLLSQNHVTAVFSGGQGNYSRSLHDGVVYINSGAGSGYTGISPADGGFTHYVLVTVDRNNVNYLIMQPGQVEQRDSLTNEGVTTVYNLSPSPIILNNIGILVPAQWRAKRSGLLTSELMRYYKVSATIQSAPGGLPTDCSVIGILKGTDRRDSDALLRSVDTVFVRTAVPAGGAVQVSVTTAN